MIKIITLVLTVASFQLSILSQDSINPIKLKRKIYISDFNFNYGINSKIHNRYTLDSYKSIAPQSVFLNEDLSDYDFTFSALFFISNRINQSYSAGIGLKLSEPKKSNKVNTTFRVGVQINNYISQHTVGHYNSIFNYKVDTSSNINGYVFYDSVFSKSISMNYKGTYIQLDGSLIIETNSKSKLSFFTGIGSNFGTVINSFVQISKNENHSIRIIKNNQISEYRVGSFSDNIKDEKVKVKKGFYSQIYIPIGLNYQLSKKNDFLQKVELFSEMRPHISFIKIAHLSTQINLSNSILFGCRVTW